jgi:hypothetical protein
MEGSTLSVLVVEARDLKIKGTLNPYAVISLGEDQK